MRDLARTAISSVDASIGRTSGRPPSWARRRRDRNSEHLKEIEIEIERVREMKIERVRERERVRKR